jgi:serpin B
MKTKRAWLLALLLAPACGGPSSTDASTAGDPGGSAGSGAEVTGDAMGYARSSAAFGAALYREMARAPGNVAMSPASLSTALTMTWAGARGETADELARALALDPETAHEAAAAQLALWNGEHADYTLRVASRLFADRSLPLEPAFEAITRDRYGAPIEGVDFLGDPSGARDTINAWARERTEARIPEVLPVGAIRSNTRLVITNAVYFHGRWAAPFDRARTADASFRLGDGQVVEVPTMQRTGGYAYGEVGSARVLELPYVGDALSMLLVLPADGAELGDLEEGLDAARLASFGEGLVAQRVALSLPRFRIDGAPVALKGALRALGVVRAFDPDGADLSGIAAAERLFVDEVYHRAFIDVNEEGTEAAAATAVVVQTRRASPPPVDYRVDRPFLFLLRDRRSGAFLFIGRVADPRG